MPLKEKPTVNLVEASESTNLGTNGTDEFLGDLLAGNVGTGLEHDESKRLFTLELVCNTNDGTFGDLDIIKEG